MRWVLWWKETETGKQNKTKSRSFSRNMEAIFTQNKINITVKKGLNVEKLSQGQIWGHLEAKLYIYLIEVIWTSVKISGRENENVAPIRSKSRNGKYDEWFSRCFRVFQGLSSTDSSHVSRSPQRFSCGGWRTFGVTPPFVSIFLSLRPSSQEAPRAAASAVIVARGYVWQIQVTPQQTEVNARHRACSLAELEPASMQ